MDVYVLWSCEDEPAHMAGMYTTLAAAQAAVSNLWPQTSEWWLGKLAIEWWSSCGDKFERQSRPWVWRNGAWVRT